MALALKELTVRTIQVPQYLNDRVRDFKLWYVDNLPALERYYNELRPFCEEGTEPLDDFFGWAVIQHEREEMKQLTESAAATSASADRAPLDLQVPGSRGSVSMADELRRILLTPYADSLKGTPNFCPKCVGLGNCYCEIASND